jgi:hypothetical protein
VFAAQSAGMVEHVWLQGKEYSPANREKYMAYLRDVRNIKLPEGGKLFEGSSESQFLGVEMEDIEIKVNGNIDVVIAGSHHQDINTTRQHMWGGLELKKRDNTKKPTEILRQVVLQHLAASYLNMDTGILTIMTDLSARWHFFWFSETRNRLLKYEATMAEAHYLIHHMMDKSVSGVSTPEDFLNRASWNQAVKRSRPDSLPGESSHDNTDENGEEESNSDENADQSKMALTQSGRTTAVDIAGAQTSSGSDKQILPGKRLRGKDYCTDDTSLDCMDEEERNEELFHAVIRNLLAGMFPEGRAEERSCNGPPRTIMFAN